MLIVVAREGVLQARYLNEEIERLRALCLDLEWIRAGVLPSVENLEDAPLLDNYEITLRDVPALKGRVVAHPIIGTATALTSELRVMAPDLALQLPFDLRSESIGHHDSGGHGWREHRLRRRWSFGHLRCAV